MRKYRIAIITLICCLLSTCLAEPLPSAITFHYFYDIDCESCTSDEEFVTIVHNTIGDIDDLYPYVINEVNVFQPRGTAAFEQLTDQIGLSRENLQFPLLIVDSKIFQGLETIERNLREAYLTAGEDIFINQYVYWPSRDKDTPLFERYTATSDHATIVYYYRTVCPECAEVEPFIAALPDTILTDGQEVSLDVVRINTRSGNNNKRIAAFFEAWQVPEADQSVPIVFLKDEYLCGKDAILGELYGRIEAGGGLDFTFPKGD